MGAIDSTVLRSPIVMTVSKRFVALGLFLCFVVILGKEQKKSKKISLKCIKKARLRQKRENCQLSFNFNLSIIM